MRFDHPISQDNLGRRPFADRLSRLISGWKGQESLVVGLFGAWGSGKTTVVNLLRESLEDMPDDDRPLTINFNPWQWNAQHQLTAAFFSEVAAQLGHSQLKEADETAAKLSRYGVMLTLGASLFESVEKIGPPVLGRWAHFASIIKNGLRRMATVVRDSKDSAGKEQTLTGMKADLSRALGALPRNVLVILDDVDRLTSNETAELFQLLKANADFPRVVYLVVCDPDVVEQSLSRAVTGRGPDFLQKIVQVGFHIPRLVARDQERLVMDGIKDVLSVFGLEERMNVARWSVIYDGIVDHYLVTPRDIVRFLSSLEFTMADLATRFPKEFEVVDFLLLEVLRMFERGVYERIAVEKVRLSPTYLFDPKEKAAEFMTHLVEPADASRRAFADAIVRDLFPRFGPTDYRPRYTQRTSPVCKSESFDRYFFFSVHDSELSEAESSSLLVSRGNADSLLDMLRSARDRNCLAEAIEILTTSENETEAEAPHILKALARFVLEVESHIPSFRGTILNDLQVLAYRAVFAVPKERRGEVYLSAFGGEVAPVLGALLLPTGNPIEGVDENTVGRAREKLVAAVRLAARDGMLLHTRHAEWLLHNWNSMSPAEVRAFSTGLLNDPKDALLLLMAYAHRPLSNVHRRITWPGQIGISRGLEDVVDPVAFAQVLQTLDENSVSFDEFEALRAFLQTGVSRL